MKDKSVLHDHLDGGLRPSTIIELAALSSIKLPTTDKQLLEDWFFENISSDLNQVFYKFELTKQDYLEKLPQRKLPLNK